MILPDLESEYYLGLVMLQSFTLTPTKTVIPEPEEPVRRRGAIPQKWLKFMANPRNRSLRKWPSRS